ncbi:MAG: ParA family protein [Pseudanabaena sp.]
MVPNHFVKTSINSKNKLNDPYGRAYTHIIVDCPPSLGLITLNALSLSRYFIVPTFLDAYSHWGLDKIVERVDHDTLSRNVSSSGTSSSSESSDI